MNGYSQCVYDLDALLDYIEENENNIKFTIDNFENVITYYEEYKNGKKYIECECCKKRVIQKTHNVKYCPKCRMKVVKKT